MAKPCCRARIKHTVITKTYTVLNSPAQLTVIQVLTRLPSPQRLSSLTIN